MAVTAAPNERLRTAMLRTGTTAADLAACCGVDPKTVERWLSGRIPHGKTRWDAARRLGYDEDYLWPDAPGRDPLRRIEAARSELVRLYPDRGSIHRETWHDLFGGAREEIAVLVYAALFLAEDAGIRRVLTEQARAGVRVRMLFGDPACDAVARRGEEEGIGAAAIGAKIRNILALFRPLALEGQAEIRLHGTTLYNSLYQADDQVLVNSHVYGSVANTAPVLHLRKISGGSMTAAYLDCFTRIWDQAKPWNGEDA